MHWATIWKTGGRPGDRPGKERMPLLAGEKGFALVAALMAIWILTALGVLVFTVSTQDIRISGRLVCEKKGFSAAETGLHWLTANFLYDNPTASAVSLQKLDTSAGSPVDPNDRYSIGPGSIGPVSPDNPSWFPTAGPAIVWYPGFDLEWGRTINTARATGLNTRCQTGTSGVSIDVGVGYGPVPIGGRR
jgi:hypothetical protein